MTEQVNHPQHYNWRKDGIECIDIIRHYVYDIGAAIKYLWRAGKKQSQGKSERDKEIEDLKKAIWYIEDYIANKTELLTYYVSDREMLRRIELMTGYKANQITAPYDDYVSAAMYGLLFFGLIYNGDVCNGGNCKTVLRNAIKDIKNRIKEMEK